MIQNCECVWCAMFLRTKIRNSCGSEKCFGKQSNDYVEYTKHHDVKNFVVALVTEVGGFMGLWPACILM